MTSLAQHKWTVAMPPGPTPGPTPPNQEDLRQGGQGDVVKQLQLLTGCV